MNLANKYRPKSFDDVTEQGVTTEILTKLCQSEDLQLRNFLLIGPAGTGKAQPLYSKVLTPQGFVPMEYIAVGDEVITPSGRVARVRDIYPQGEREVYKIYTDDDSFFEVADNHLNLVRIEPEGCTMVDEIPEEVIETKELINIFNTQSVNVSIPCCQPYSFTYFPVPFSPYILGQELFHITFFGNEGNIVFNNLTPERFMMISDYLKDKNMPYCVEDGTIKLLQDVELVKQTAMMYIHNGVIAGQYTYNSPLIRKELLRGFLDGSSVDISRKQVGMTVSRATYRRLDWLLDIVRSLGLGLKVIPIGGGDDSQYVQVTITFTREVNFFDSRSSEVLPCKCYRKITKIEKSGSTRCKCIFIDDPDHTYITDNYSVTHNTTSARIMAKMLNGDDGQIIEIDAASHSSVNDMRDIVEQAKTYPVGCKYKVILVDECHALSSAAWQSMLTCLESNPARTVFVLCTTNPEKIPATILSRVQTFQLSKISLKGIQDRLIHILDCEIAEGRDITYDKEAVNYIAKLAQGGMRDAITLLDKALSYSNNINTANIEKSLNLPNYDDYFKLLTFIVKKDNTGIVTVINDVYDSGVNFVKWFDGFMAFISNIIKYIYIQDISQTMIPEHYQDRIASYGVAHAAICLKLSNKLVKLNQELRNTQYLQELAITYLCTTPNQTK